MYDKSLSVFVGINILESINKRQNTCGDRLTSCLSLINDLQLLHKTLSANSGISC